MSLRRQMSCLLYLMWRQMSGLPSRTCIEEYSLPLVRRYSTVQSTCRVYLVWTPYVMSGWLVCKVRRQICLVCSVRRPSVYKETAVGRCLHNGIRFQMSAYCIMKTYVLSANEMTDVFSANYQKYKILSACGRQMSCLPCEKINQVVGNWIQSLHHLSLPFSLWIWYHPR